MFTKQAQTMQRKNKSAGFTLLELMMAVAIMGILMAVAVPMYRDYLIRSRVQEPTSVLSDLRVRMEQYYQDYRNYGTGGVCGTNGNGVAVVQFPTRNAVGTAPRSKDFNFGCTLGAGGLSYNLAATGGEASVVGFTYGLNNLNQRTTTIANGPWATGAQRPCWVVGKGSSCQ